MNDSDWKEAYNQGIAWYRLYCGALKKREKFTTELLYNFALMGIERLFMAYFFKIEKMPYNHTMSDLTLYMNEVSSIDKNLAEELNHLDMFQNICSVNHIETHKPTEEDIVNLTQTFTNTLNFLNAKLEITNKIRSQT